MKIRVNGEQIFDAINQEVEIIVEKTDEVKILTPPEDLRACVVDMSNMTCSISIEGGTSIIESISKDGIELPVFQCSFEIHKYNGEINKETGFFILSDTTIDKENIYSLSIPMVSRLISKLLDNSGVGYQYEKLQETEIFRVNKSNREKFELLVKQCFEYRCSNSVNHGNCDVLRQLPIRVAVEESNKLIILGKKHAIYPAKLGGYDIKVENYTNSKLNEYYYNQTGMWD